MLLGRERCTTAKVRKIKRYPEDEARQALRLVMAHPMVQRTFRQRKAMVEPVFAMLRHQRKLDRFRRRGLAVVRCEFALHAIAYNLARAVALLGGHRCPFLRDLPGAVYPVFLRPTGPRTTHCLKVLILQSSDEDKHRRIQKAFCDSLLEARSWLKASGSGRRS